MSCATGKREYLTEVLAEDALLETRTRNTDDRGGPVAVYRCEDCGQWHLTSKGPVNARLAEYIRSGKLKRNQAGEDWRRKLE